MVSGYCHTSVLRLVSSKILIEKELCGAWKLIQEHLHHSKKEVTGRSRIINNL